MRERTPWFPASVDPVHEGNYEGDIEMRGSRFPLYPIRWMEGKWHVYLSANSSVGVAWLLVPPGTFGPTFRWRGLTRPAEAQR